MLQVEHLNVAYDTLQVLWDVSLEVREGEIVALIGSNGAGKTTLLRTISGLMKPLFGSIRFIGEEIAGLPPHEICRRGVIQVPEGRALFPRMRVLENLELGAYLPAARAQRHETIEYVYHLFPRLKERWRQDAGTLSGGEQQMVAIGRALMARPKLLMLDEPSLGLAPVLVETIMEVLTRLNAEGMTILLVSQEVHQALAIAHRAYVIENGRIVRSGSSRELRDDDAVRSAYLGL
ncbi:ABC transporter ATP-binding protein [Roseiflexus sp.]|uniref:ABC transporter ATP-binding protein n=1 Tax=Roseiflexus sp. TaxID=2562120 RepID=UPI0021DD8227|nr:ABC transporter ATP-binding protein [Roseiflexus sp.]GIW01330.1 MAG: ABC transporter ATP-binding protein [Roseiflexus sp.]